MLLSGVHKCGYLGLRLAPRTGVQLLSPLGAMAGAQRGMLCRKHQTLRHEGFMLLAQLVILQPHELWGLMQQWIALDSHMLHCGRGAMFSICLGCVCSASQAACKHYPFRLITTAQPSASAIDAMSAGDAQRQYASIPKIKVDNPVVDLDGDEMTRCADLRIPSTQAVHGWVSCFHSIMLPLICKDVSHGRG